MEGRTNGVLVTHSKGRTAGVYVRSMDPDGFQLAFYMGAAGLVFCVALALWCTWRSFKPGASSHEVQ